MEQFIEKIRSNWEDSKTLSDVLLDVALEECRLAREIAQLEATTNAAFISEKEESFKSTDAIARARAKSLVGSSQTRYEYEFTICSQLITLLTSRISQLDQ